MVERVRVERTEEKRASVEWIPSSTIRHPPSCSVSNQSIMVNHTLQSLRQSQVEEDRPCLDKCEQCES